MKKLASVVILLSLVPDVFAIGIFNTFGGSTATKKASVSVPAPAASASIPSVIPPAPVSAAGYNPVTPPPASAVQTININQQALSQFERRPNEPDDAFIARMKVVYQRSASDLSKTTQGVVDNIKSLAPK